MPDVALIPSGTGEIIDLGAMQIRVLEDGSKTDNRFGSILLTIPPKTDGPPLHWHRMHDETFFITKGRVRFVTDKGNHDTKAGDYVVVPIKAIHSFSNPFDEPAEFFNTFTPAFYVDYLRLLAQGIAQKGKLDEEQHRAIMLQFATFAPGDDGYLE
ncbi:Uncharacterized protein BP5553_04874 [Venustampulla echinocandica]|uniref:Cupin type-2 domain-containing protein n=1 Tax=Venustampulla echinocandica TaxID=2656787 RepID=A0A370TPI5_9HELO|nr:Uncharacterized protein BP5553_04874 [Venustampulla echinocandica]RDL37441.1 Uncharacterized protein BP5553_04874 [Venustampulla echinocandica]